MSYVILGGVKHALAPSTVGSMEALQAALNGKHASPIAYSVAVLNAQLVKPIDASTPARIDELGDAVREVFKHVGMKDSAAGEAAAPASGA